MRVRRTFGVLLAVLAAFEAAWAAGPRPLGPPFVVAAGDYNLVYDRFNLDVAGDDFGNFIIVWSNYDQVRGVRLSQSDVAGTPFAIGDDPIDRHLTPRVAVRPAGDFVVTWTTSPLSSGTWLPATVVARRFDGTASPLGDPMPIRGFTQLDGWRARADVSIAGDGAFVVVWDDLVPGDVVDVFAQRLDAAGNSVGGAFVVNANAYGAYPVVAMDPAGGFVVAWESSDGYDGNVAARRFRTDGTPVQPDTLVNEMTTGSQWRARVGTDDAGNFVVAWYAHYDENRYGTDVVARRFGSDAAPIGGATRVAKDTWPTGRESPDLAVDPGGGFVVAWSSFYYEDGDIMARGASGSDQAMGPAIRMSARDDNGYSSKFPRVATGGSGDFLVVWFDPDHGVMARRLGPARTTTKLRIRDAGDPTGRKLAIKPLGAVSSSRLGRRIDPVRDGAFLHVYNAAGSSGDSVCIPLPAVHWQAKGTDPSGATRFVYRDAKSADGPCTNVTVANRKVVKAACLAGSHAVDFSLDEQQQGGIAVRLVTGERAYCSTFGTDVLVDEPGRFVGTDTMAAGECPPAPSACP